MRAPTKTELLASCLVLAGVGTMYLFRLIVGDEPPAERYDFLWEKVFVSSTILFGFVCAVVEPRAPWRWPLIMAYAHYFSGFYVMKYWGQIPPIELVYISLLSLPAVITGYLGSLVRKKIGNSQGKQDKQVT